MSLNEVIAENPTVSRTEAIRELKKHSADLGEFFEEIGDKPSYKALDVLYWLGY